MARGANHVHFSYVNLRELMDQQKI